MDLGTHREGVGGNAGLEEGREGEREGPNRKSEAVHSCIEMEVADDGNGGGKVEEVRGREGEREDKIKGQRQCMAA